MLYEEAEVVVAFDNDEAGQAAAEKLAAVFQPHSRLFIPPEGMDINEWWLANPKDLSAALAAFTDQEGLA